MKSGTTQVMAPVIFILTPIADQVLPPGTTSTTLTVDIANYTGPWCWKLNEPFPASGPADGNRVASGNISTATELQDGQIYTVYVVLVDGDGNVLSAPQSVTFSVGEFVNEAPVISDIPDQTTDN